MAKMAFSLKMVLLFELLESKQREIKVELEQDSTTML